MPRNNPKKATKNGKVRVRPSLPSDGKPADIKRLIRKVMRNAKRDR